MTERTDQWPRVHSCVNDWCPRQSDDCKRCDKLIAILREHYAEKAALNGELAAAPKK